MRTTITLLLLITVLGVQAQERRLRRAQRNFEKERYERTHRLLKKVLRHKDTRNEVEAILLAGKTYLALSRDEDFLEDEPKALYEALKLADKGLRKSKPADSLRFKEQAFLDTLYRRALEQANADLEKGKFIPANRYFEKVYEMTSDPKALWGQGRVAIALKDTATAVKYAERVSSLILEDSRNNQEPKIGAEPFLEVIHHFNRERRFDTAAFIAENAFLIYPDDARIKPLLLKSFLLDVTSQRPDLSTLQKFAHMRPVFKDDSLYLHKENVLFLYLINYFAAQQNDTITDQIISGFAQIKKDYVEEFGQAHLDRDPLYDKDQQEFLFNIMSYAARMERGNMVRSVLNAYVSGDYADSAFQAMKAPERWKALFSRVKDERSIFLLGASIEQSKEVLKKERWFPNYKLSLISMALKESDKYADRTAMLNFLKYVDEEYPKNRDLQYSLAKTSLALAEEYIDSAYYSYARLALKQHDQRFFFYSDGLDALKQKFVVNDFYGSRLLKEKVNDQFKYEWYWSGNELLCAEGKVPKRIQDKVEQRINYFRRAAGVPDYVWLDSVKNAACQRAALIYQVNDGKLFNKPAETWKCYTLSSENAALFSAKVFGQTTVFAVTSLMADLGEENITVGNRRWMLYPPARIMGHGSTDEVALIWTLDESGEQDTTRYMHDYVSWPPKDYCPVMFKFPRWHFSMYADLSNAKVSVIKNGKAIRVIQEKLVDGYGMPSIVWRLDGDDNTEGAYKVTITGIRKHGERKATTISYPVKFINPMELHKAD